MLRLYLIMSIILSIKLDISFLSTSLFLVIFDVCYRLIFMVIGQVAMTLTDDGHKTKPCKIICHLPSNWVCLNLLPQCSLLLFFTLLDIMIMVLRFLGIYFRLNLFKVIVKHYGTKYCYNQKNYQMTENRIVLNKKRITDIVKPP